MEIHMNIIDLSNILPKKDCYTILVLSDSHGRNDIIEDILTNEPDADVLFHCGDVCADLSDVTRDWIPAYAVAGNCDYSGDYPDELLIKLAGYQFYLTHGHRYSVDWRTDLLCYAGKEKLADVVCFGHTHVPGYDFDEGILLLNPGSVARPRQKSRVATYAKLTIQDGNFPKVEMMTV